MGNLGNLGNLDYQRDEHHMHLIVYHLIWCPKRRRKVLVNQIGKRCEDLIRQKCEDGASPVAPVRHHLSRRVAGRQYGTESPSRQVHLGRRLGAIP